MSVISKFKALSDWLRRTDERETCELVFKPMLPCFGCAASRTLQSNSQKRVRCSGCKYACYHNQACAKANWKHHKSLCKRMQSDASIRDVLMRAYHETGLFTDGTHWWASPFRGKPQLLELGCILQTVVQMKPSMARNVNVMLTSFQRKLIEGEDILDNDDPTVLSLSAHATRFHTVVYGFAMPWQYKEVGKVLKEAGVTQCVDPLAGTGIGADLFRVFAQIPVAASDLTPGHSTVALKDALDPSTYAGYDLTQTPVIIAWPDFKGEGKLGADLIRLLYGLGVPYLVVMHEGHVDGIFGELESAFSKESMDALNVCYNQVDPIFEPFYVYDMKPGSAILTRLCDQIVNHTQKDVGNSLIKAFVWAETEAMISKGVGQSIALYKIVA